MTGGGLRGAAGCHGKIGTVGDVGLDSASTIHQPGNFGPVFSICQNLSFLIAK